MPLAPIVLFVYNRPWHTQKTVESLQLCEGAKESELFIFSDGAKNDAAKPLVEEVRRYIRQINGFAKVTLKESTDNKGLATSVITGVSEILSIYDHVIVLEDDLLFSCDCLQFLNDSLKTYADSKDIFSISAYLFPLKTAMPKQEVLLLPRNGSWGWAIWRDRWELADWDMSYFETFRKDRLAQAAFAKGGKDLVPMLYKQQKGIIDSWAIRWCFTQYQHHAFGLFPSQSKVRSIGTDSSGTHVGNTKKYDTTVHEGYTLPKKVNTHPTYTKALQRFFEPSLIRKFINKIKYGI